MQAVLDTQLWSKEKISWSKKSIGLNFPTHFSMVSGCAVSLNNHQVLFVGGHHTMEYHQTHPSAYTRHTYVQGGALKLAPLPKNFHPEKCFRMSHPVF